LLAGPTNFINQILRILKLSDDCSNYNEMPDIIINLSGTDFVLKPADYIIKQDESDYLKFLMGGVDTNQ